MPESYFSEDITETEPADWTNGQQVSEHNKILIAYFTWAENSADTTEVDATTSASVQPPGNVAQMAAWIQQVVGGNYSPSGWKNHIRLIMKRVLTMQRMKKQKMQDQSWLEEIGY